jgi:hypothetical protein
MANPQPYTPIDNVNTYSAGMVKKYKSLICPKTDTKG